VIPDTLAQLEYEALRAEERDRMNGRTQVWTLYLTIVGVFGFVTVQSGMSSSLVALCPLVLACLARHSRHSEDVLKQVRKYLYLLEEKSGYCGYEHFTRSVVRPTYGGYIVALRDAFLLTDVLALTGVLLRLYEVHVPLLVSIAVSLVDLVAIVFTCLWLSRSSKRKSHAREHLNLKSELSSSVHFQGVTNDH
jgi:hypothetical protein